MFHTIDLTGLKYIEKQPIIKITLHKTKTFVEISVLLQTRWQTEYLVPRVLLKFGIPLCKPKNYFEPIKQ